MKNHRMMFLVLAALLSAGTSLAITACEEKEGPAERIGEEIDEAVEEAKDAVDR